MTPMTEYIEEYDVAKLNALAAKSAARAEGLSKQNAKLKELVRDINKARLTLCNAYPDAQDLDCNECVAFAYCQKGEGIGARMRELGVEVDV